MGVRTANYRNHSLASVMSCHQSIDHCQVKRHFLPPPLINVHLFYFSSESPLLYIGPGLGSDGQSEVFWPGLASSDCSVPEYPVKDLAGVGFGFLQNGLTICGMYLWEQFEIHSLQKIIHSFSFWKVAFFKLLLLFVCSQFDGKFG